MAGEVQTTGEPAGGRPPAVRGVGDAAPAAPAADEGTATCHFGHPVPADAYFCPRCGVPLARRPLDLPASAVPPVASVAPVAPPQGGPAAVPVGLAYEPPPLVKFCTVCGAGLVARAAICPRCGSPVDHRAPRRRRGRAVAVLLAVFFSFFTWLYTYAEDAVRFWIGLGVNLAGAALYVALALTSSKPGWIVVWLLPSLAVWLWAIVTQANRDFSRLR